MREVRTSLAVVAVLLVAGCSKSGLSGEPIILTPTVGTTSVMECLDQEAQKLGYKILRLDRQDGYMLAERRDKSPDISAPREYAGGDRITVNRQKKVDGVQPLALVPTSYVMEWLANGSNQRSVKPRESVIGDAKALSERCRL